MSRATPEQLAEQQRIADTLVANGEAMRKPCNRTRCWATIELKCLSGDLGRRGNLYVTPAGAVRHGYTLKGSTPIAPDKLAAMLAGLDVLDAA